MVCKKVSHFAPNPTADLGAYDLLLTISLYRTNFLNM
jgi:hypothetical protein